jgi:hypothetical protein
MKDKTSPVLISHSEMVDAINRSGYLIEQRVEDILSDYDYYVLTNPAYEDTITGKSREYDIFAMASIYLDDDGKNIIFPVIICECMNNYQPIVFFLKDEMILSEFMNDEIKCSGLPIKFKEKGKYISFPEFTKLHKHHHYAKGPFATQYCSFTRKDKNSPWIASHIEKHHQAIEALIQALEYEIKDHYDIWNIKGLESYEDANIQIYYLLIVFQGKLYGAKPIPPALRLKRLDHIQLVKEFVLHKSGKKQTYYIDVISENYLPKYLKILNKEFNVIKRFFINKGPKINNAIMNIIYDSRKLDEKPASYRVIFEFKD